MVRHFVLCPKPSAALRLAASVTWCLLAIGGPRAARAEPDAGADAPADEGRAPTDDTREETRDEAPAEDPPPESGASAVKRALPSPPEPVLRAAPAPRAALRAMTGIPIFAADGRCLDVQGDRRAGSPVVVAPCHGEADQRWTVTPGGRIRGTGGVCLDVQGGSTLPGTDIAVAWCDRGPGQTFERSVRDELRVLGMCLDLDRPAVGDLARVELRPCDGSRDQRWSLGGAPIRRPTVAVQLVEGDGTCPPDATPLPAAEARMHGRGLCRQLGQWHIVRLADGGSMDGPGYGCGVRDRDERPLGHTLCRRAR